MRIINFINNKYSNIYKNSFQKKARKRLVNEDFSIITSNCIGGIIYNRLGKKFLSPNIILGGKYEYR